MTDPATATPAARQRRRGFTLLAAVLAGLLGFGIVAATRPSSPEAALVNARETDLVQLLDDLDQRQLRLEQERLELQSTEQRLGSADTAQRLQEAQRRAASLAVLAGTAPASGAGITMTISDSTGSIEAPVLLNAVQELRDAGAYAMSVNEVRIVAGTWFAEASRPGSVVVSGQQVTPPYVFRVLGDPATLSTAMQIPGGVADTVRTDGGRIAIADRGTVAVSAVQPLQVPRYAEPVPSQS